MTISNEFRGQIKKVFEPIALAMGRLGLTPNGADAHRLRDLDPRRGAPRRRSCGSSAAIVVFVGGASTCSTARSPERPADEPPRCVHGLRLRRWGEAVVFLGITWGAVPPARGCHRHPRHRRPGRAFMVSYTRAKSEGLGFSVGHRAWRRSAIMPREIRLVIMSVGIVLDRMTGIGTTAIRLRSAVILVGAVITVIQRIVHDPPPGEVHPHRGHDRPR